MKKKVIIFFFTVTTFLYSAANPHTDWEPTKIIDISDGVVFEENNQIFFIEPVFKNQDKINKFIGYKKFLVNINVDNDNIKNLVKIEENINCSECEKLFTNEISLLDFLKTKTKYKDILVLSKSNSKSIRNIIQNKKINNNYLNIDVQYDGVYYNVFINLKDKNGKQTTSYETTGSLMFVKIIKNYFYLGIIDWGGSGHTAYLLIWKV